MTAGAAAGVGSMERDALMAVGREGRKEGMREGGRDGLFALVVGERGEALGIVVLLRITNHKDR